MDKLDMRKLLNDIRKYGDCGVPREKLDFWNSQLEKSLKELTTGADSEVPEGEMIPLEQLMGKQKYTVSMDPQQIPPAITNVVDKDRAPLPEVINLSDFAT